MAHYRESIRDYEILNLEDFEFQSGITVPNVKLAYKTYGKLNNEADNAILLLHGISGTHESTASVLTEGKERAISPQKHFIIAPNMFGNGLSSSPSNTPPPFDGPDFPPVTIYDNVRAQHKLVTEELGISKLRLVVGSSMGGLQSFHWAAIHPDVVENVLPICATAKCSGHNWLFLEGLVATLEADPIFAGGSYAEYPHEGMRAFCTVYAAWAFSQEFFRQDGHIKLGLNSSKDTPDVLAQLFVPQDPNDLLIRIRTWQNADISDNSLYKGDLNAALGSIKAKAIVMPSSTDQYFWPDDNRDEVSAMHNAEFREIPTMWGHMGGLGMDPADREFVDRAIRDLID